MSTYIFILFFVDMSGSWRMSTTCRHKRMSTTALYHTHICLTQCALHATSVTGTVIQGTMHLTIERYMYSWFPYELTTNVMSKVNTF